MLGVVEKSVLPNEAVEVTASAFCLNLWKKTLSYVIVSVYGFVVLI